MSNSDQTVYRVGAVSYLNTLPLVYGMLHGPQAATTEVTFSIPSVCAEELKAGRVAIGLVPVAEIARQQLEVLPGVGIVADGAVRSILLFSKTPWPSIKTLAADASSRTSVELARVVLREQYGVLPHIVSREPDLESMLSQADAALIIGDPALRIDPAQQDYECIDLAEAWLQLTGLPFVFAAWAGKAGVPDDALREITTGSYAFGRRHIDDIVRQEARSRGISEALADRYLRHHLHYEIGTRELQGWEVFLSLAGLSQAAGIRA